MDVSKHRLEVFELGSRETYSIANSLDAIEQWLDRFQISIRVAIEPTNSYHEGVRRLSTPVDSRSISSIPTVWRALGKASGQRVKADRQDAQLLARYLEREVSERRLWVPITPAQQSFWRLLKRRATLVRAKVQRHHSLVDLDSLQADVDA